MNIVYASSESYARHTAVSMVSLFEANKKRRTWMFMCFPWELRTRAGNECRKWQRAIIESFGA